MIPATKTMKKVLVQYKDSLKQCHKLVKPQRRCSYK
jgi:hypothetical protein